MTRKLHFYMAGYLLLILFLHVNAILKAEDPISDTQTDPIAYDQKMEQEKDGVKAPATPKMIYYGGQGFLTKSSLSKYEKDMELAQTAKKKDKFNWADWWDDKPAQNDTSSNEITAEGSTEEPMVSNTEFAGETVSEPAVPAVLPQLKPAKNPPQDENLDVLPATSTADETSKEGDDWW